MISFTRSPSGFLTEEFLSAHEFEKPRVTVLTIWGKAPHYGRSHEYKRNSAYGDSFNSHASKWLAVHNQSANVYAFPGYFAVNMSYSDAVTSKRQLGYGFMHCTPSHFQIQGK